MLKWIGRIITGVVAFIVFWILVGVGIIFADSVFGPKTTDAANLTFTDSSGNELYGYLAMPEGEGPFPAVLLIHEWWGLNEGMPILAEALAEEGYVVLAPDAYRGKVTNRIFRALYLRLTTPEDQVKADLDTALAYLQNIPEADASRTASMGFCFGGGHSLQLGLRQSENLAVTVMYYGAVVTEPSLLRPFTDGQAVLGIFADEDQTIFVDEVLEFEAALNSLDINNQITIYEGVGHAFLTEENYNEPGPGGDAWQEAVVFLEENLKNTP